MQKREPAVSVIICAYNAEKYLKEAIDSVLCQTYPSYELLLVNDGSHDGTLSIMEAAQRERPDQTVHIVNLEKNGGLGNARNLGVEAAKGAYFAFLDSDDRLKPNFLEEMMAPALCEGADAVCCGQDLIDREGKTLREMLPLQKDKAGRARWRLHAVLTVLFCTRTVQQSGVLSPCCTLYEDVAFCIALAPFLKKVEVVRKPLYEYRISSSSISQTGLCQKMASSPESNKALFGTAARVLAKLQNPLDCYLLQYKIKAIYYDYLLYSLARCEKAFTLQEYARWQAQMESYFPHYKKVSMAPFQARLLPHRQAFAWWLASGLEKMGLLKSAVFFLQKRRGALNTGE